MNKDPARDGWLVPRWMSMVFVTAAVTVVAACRAEPSTILTWMDSAGVVHTVTPDSWRVFGIIDPEPVLSLGGPDVSGPSQFFDVRGIHLDGEGKIWVADGGSGEVRVFLPDGSHWKTSGGQGEGPGEFRRVRLLGPFRGDSMAVWDDGNPRLTVMDPAGNLARTTKLQRGDEAPPRAVDIFPDGSILAKKPVVLSAGSLDPGQLLADTVDLARVDLDDRTEERQGIAPGPLWVWTGRSQVPIPFTINSPIDLLEDEVHLSVGAEFRIQVFLHGHLTEEYGVERPSREASREAVEAYIRLYEEYITDPVQRGEYLSTIDHPERPSHLPAYDQLVTVSDGSVWARIYSPDLSKASWDVFGPNRAWMGQAELPDGFTLFAVRDHRLFGIWRDGLGVEYLRVFEVRK